MRILNLGSLNIDKVYSVEHFVQAGETISALGLQNFCGGKGLNQSVALARAGADVFHAGAVGEDGEELRSLLQNAGANAEYLQTLPGPSGHAVIQVSPKGQNCIIVAGGTNVQITPEYIDSVLQHFGEGDVLLLQNEISSLAYAMEKAKQAGLKIALNPSPIDAALLACPLDLVDYFLLNEIEGKALTDEAEGENRAVLERLALRFPRAAIVLTVGKAGVMYKCGEEEASHGIYDVPVVDTTAAGDTFCGYFLAGVAAGLPIAKTLENASIASSIAVSRSGASPSIPTMEEVEAFAKNPPV